MGNLLSLVGERDVNGLRQLANEHEQKRHQCFQQSQAAYHRGDHAGAKRASLQGKEHDLKSKELHAQAAAKAFAANNRDRAPHEVDLHGLRVKEALSKAEEAIRLARQQERKHLVFIVGRGLHSSDGVSKLRPAVMGLVDRFNLRCTANKPTAGCIYVELVRPEERGWLDSLVQSFCIIC